MRVVNYHEKDNRSVLDLPTPLELFKESHSAKEYEELMSFYQSDEWQEGEREGLNSDRRYYEGRKVTKLPNDTKAVSDKKKFYEPEPFQLRIERKLCKCFEDVFDDPALRRCVKELTDKQYAVIKLFCKDHTYEEIAELTGTTLNNVSKLKTRALNSIREQYPQAALGCPDRVPYNIKRHQEYIEGQKKKAEKPAKAA